MTLSEARRKVLRIQQARVMVEMAQSLDDVYTQLNQLSSDVLDLYPQIACRTQCNTCCKGPSMPTVTPSEWERVHDYLLRYYSEDQRQALIARVRQMYNPHKDIYWAVHDTIQQPADLAKVEAFGRLLPQLNDTQCPMIVDDKCSVYMSRPAKCRAHGAFLHVFGPHVQFHACADEVDKMEQRLKMQGSRDVVMPIWNHFEEQIYQRFNAPDATATVLVIWVLTHVRDGKLVEEVCLLPDFEAFRGQTL